MKYSAGLLLLFLSISTEAQKAGFTYSYDGSEPRCAGWIIKFTDTSVGAGTWLWDFGSLKANPPTSTLQNPIVTIDDTGNIVITLTINGGASVAADTIWQNAYPTACIEPFFYLSGCAPFSVDFKSCSHTNPPGGQLTYSWRFMDGDTSVLENLTHIYAIPNKYEYIELVVKNDSGCSFTLGKDINIEVKNCTGIEPLANAPFIGSLYPNPAIDIARLEYKFAPNTRVTLMLIDVLGRKAGEYLLDNNREVFELNTSNLKNGIYFCALKNAKSITWMNKLIVNH